MEANIEGIFLLNSEFQKFTINVAGQAYGTVMFSHRNINI